MFNKKDLKTVESVMMLYEVKRSRGKKAAARNLNTSIDTLNKYLENLEEELGAKLLVTRRHQCELTKQGEKAVLAAEKIRECLSEVYAEASSEKEIKGQVRIAYERNTFLPQLCKIYEKYPQLSFCFDAFEKISEMKNHLYDICLCYTIPKDNDAVVVYAREIPCGFFASKGYVKEHGNPENFEDLLLHHKLILKREFSEQLKLSGKKVFQLISNNSFLIKEAVAHDAGIGVLPFVQVNGKEDFVCLKNIPCCIKCCLYLVSYRKIKEIPKIRMVLDYYKRSLQQMTFTDFQG